MPVIAVRPKTYRYRPSTTSAHTLATPGSAYRSSHPAGCQKGGRATAPARQRNSRSRPSKSIRRSAIGCPTNWLSAVACAWSTAKAWSRAVCRVRYSATWRETRSISVTTSRFTMNPPICSPCLRPTVRRSILRWRVTPGSAPVRLLCITAPPRSPSRYPPRWRWQRRWTSDRIPQSSSSSSAPTGRRTSSSISTTERRLRHHCSLSSTTRSPRTGRTRTPSAWGSPTI